jgi:hypothetical protein
MIQERLYSSIVTLKGGERKKIEFSPILKGYSAVKIYRLTLTPTLPKVLWLTDIRVGMVKCIIGGSIPAEFLAIEAVQGNLELPFYRKEIRGYFELENKSNIQISCVWNVLFAGKLEAN